MSFDDVVFSDEKDWIEVNNLSIKNVCEKVKLPQAYPIQIEFANPY